MTTPARDPVSVRAVFYVEPGAGAAPGAGAEITIQVPPFSRQTLSPAEYPALHNRKFAAFFEASGPVIMERAIYWGEGLQAVHASAGAILPDATPSFAPPTGTDGPAVTGISPNRGAPSGGTVATITGSGLGLLSWSGGETTLTFGITPVPRQNITVLDANAIRVVTPPSGRGLSNVLVNSRGVPLELVGAFEFVELNLAGPPVGYGDLRHDRRALRLEAVRVLGGPDRPDTRGRDHRPLDDRSTVRAATVPRRPRRQRRLAVPRVPLATARH